MKTVLVIDDNDEMRSNIAEILELAPYQVIQAANGKQGVTLARQTRPDLILCDIMMPELDGYGVLRILRSDPQLSLTPFLFLSAKAEAAEFRLGMNLGADDYLTKPFDDSTLLNAVELRLKKREREPIGPSMNVASLEKLAKALLDDSDTYKSLREVYGMTHYQKKQRLFTTGTLPIGVYFIARGKVKVFRLDEAGNEYITSLLGAGDFVGYVALLKQEAYAENAEVLDDAEVCIIPKADFLALLDHHPDVARQFIKLLTSAILKHEEKLLKLAYQSVRKRVAEALLLFQRKYYPLPGHPVSSQNLVARLPINTSPAMSLSRENWSHLVGASSETVIRVLSDFRAEGLIGINASQITLLDIDKLSHLKH